MQLITKKVSPENQIENNAIYHKHSELRSVDINDETLASAINKWFVKSANIARFTKGGRHVIPFYYFIAGQST